MFTLAHLSDIHLGPLPRPPFRLLRGKRIIGYANWLRGRRRIHHRPVLDAITADLRAQAPDHIAVTGDLVNIGLPAEYIAAGDWLRELGSAFDVSVIPGNHDAYVPMADEHGIGLWSEFMTTDIDLSFTPAPNRGRFPYVRVRGPIALVGLSTALATPAFNAWGRLGEEQLKPLPGILDRLAAEKRFRVVLIHHPPLPGMTSSRRALSDAAKFEEIIAGAGAELVLFGHNHRSVLASAKGPSGAVPLVGVPSASATGPANQEGRYNIYRIEGNADGWRCEMTTRAWRRGDGQVVEIDRRELQY
ncbi:MAG: metallophosphoesterase [Pseudomonadota bacterium]|nr:metallophosphoesterase [Pseudomonadota bacterium]